MDKSMHEILRGIIDKARNVLEGKVVLTNTLTHLRIGAIVGHISLVMLLWVEMVAFVWFGGLLFMIAWERAQYQRAKETHNQNKAKQKEIVPKMQWNWIDSIVDVVAGFAGYSAVFWVIQWIGGYFGK